MINHLLEGEKRLEFSKDWDIVIDYHKGEVITLTLHGKTSGVDYQINCDDDNMRTFIDHRRLFNFGGEYVGEGFQV
jgi:hypothetical protein